MKFEIDQDVCIGAGQCASAAPALFDQRDDDGVVVLLTEGTQPGSSAEREARRAIALCPSGAIRIIECTVGEGKGG